MEPKKKKKSTLGYCEGDSKHHHYWERVGVWDQDHILFRCTQCHKCKLLKIEFVSDGFVENYNYAKP